jgi:amino acid transporter
VTEPSDVAKLSDEPQVELGPGAEEAIREEVAEKITGTPSRRLYGTFSGVFTPTLLTILGVIMYLREGWVVGNAGLLGAWAIILFSYLITATTGLSLASITTNIRIGAGGAFSVISQSLGLEVGGSIGIPLYLSQTLAVAMYIFGFRAGWLWIFPEHPALIVDLVTFAVLLGIALVSAGLAFKIQYVILVIIAGSLISVAAGGGVAPPDHSIDWWGDFPGFGEEGFTGVGFWAVFAVFFPAATGIMAGANMSGELANPRRSIPLGTLSAIGVSLLVYLGLATWLAWRVPTAELLEDYTVLIDRAAWGPVVLAGLLGATFSSALSSLVGAPRILQALAEHQILPGSRWLAKRSRLGEPRNAMFLTASIVLAALMLRYLNVIAPLITMFFLITYAMINVVVLIEQSLGLVSFRPLLRIPRVVPLIGAVGCTLAMFVVNATFALFAVVVVLAVYAQLTRRQLRAPFGDVRSGLFIAAAEWAARKVARMTGSGERAWKANLLVPVEDPVDVEQAYDLLHDVAYPKGVVQLLGLTGEREYGDLLDRLPRLAERFGEEGVFARWAALELSTFADNLVAGMEALGGAFFRSSMIFLRMPSPDPVREAQIARVLADADRQRLGILLYAPGDSGPPRPGPVHLVLERPDGGWEIGLDLGGADLALLVAYKLKHNRDEQLALTARLGQETEREQALAYLKSVAELARVPNAELRALGPADEEDDLTAAITIFTLRLPADFSQLRERASRAETPCLFALDSGRENALA